MEALFKTIYNKLEAIPLQTLVEKNVKRRETVTLTDETTMEEALKILAENRILSAPVLDSKDKTRCLGMISVLNIASHVSRIPLSGDDASAAEKIKSNIDLAKTKVTECVSFDVDDDYGVLLLTKDEDAVQSSAATAALLMARAWHRIVVVDEQCTMVTTISQSDLIQEVAALLKDESMASLAGTKLQDLGIATESPKCFKSSDTVLQAVHSIADRNISAVGIVEDEGKLCGSFEAADLKGLTSETITDVLLPLNEFVKKYGSDLRGRSTASMDDTLGDIVDRLASHNSDHVFFATIDVMFTTIDNSAIIFAPLSTTQS